MSDYDLSKTYERDHERIKTVFDATRQYLGMLSATERLANEVKKKSDRLKKASLEVALAGFLLLQGCYQTPPQAEKVFFQEYSRPKTPSRCR